MKRYLKQKPKYNTKCTDIVRESERYTKAAFTIEGKNRAGKQIVKLMAIDATTINNHTPKAMSDKIAVIEPIEPMDDNWDDDDNEFIPCSKCDGHPACEDFGCAYELGCGHLIEKEITDL
jgi:hypothetical protein